MDLTPEAIDAIAGWQSAYPGFDRNDDLCKTRIQRLLDYFESSADLDCHILKDGGLSNYAVLFIFSRNDVPLIVYRHVEGLLVYMSLCAPLAVVGHTHKCPDPDMTNYVPLTIEDLIAPDAFDDPVERKTLAVIQSGGYRVLSAEEVSRPLPPGVEPYGYCDADVPAGCLFTAIFSDTD